MKKKIYFCASCYRVQGFCSFEQQSKTQMYSFLQSYKANKLLKNGECKLLDTKSIKMYLVHSCSAGLNRQKKEVMKWVECNVFNRYKAANAKIVKYLAFCFINDSK